MSLTRVTITGADDAVDPWELWELGREFPFVEWGVLFSPKRWATPRYPSSAWVERLVLALAGRDPFALSAHLCGGFSREMQKGVHAFAALLPGSFTRCQINGIGGDDRGAGLVYAAAFLKSQRPCLEIILQAKGEEVLQDLAHLASAMPNASVLFDPSGGRGVEPFSWPRVPLGARFGFAGGITPENVAQVIGEISVAQTRAEPFWIDMESGVRADDRFDVAKVRAVLEAAAPFVEVSR